MFSPENHKKHMSAFKQREHEKKMALDARRKAQEAELEAKRLAIMKKHEAAEKRVNDVFLLLGRLKMCIWDGLASIE